MSPCRPFYNYYKLSKSTRDCLALSILDAKVAKGVACYQKSKEEVKQTNSLAGFRCHTGAEGTIANVQKELARFANTEPYS